MRNKEKICNCKTKVIYSSEKFALMDIERIASISKRKNKPVRAYFCTNCEGWHLTSRSKKEHSKIKMLEYELEHIKTKLKNFNERPVDISNNLLKEKAIYSRMVKRLNENFKKSNRINSSKQRHNELIIKEKEIRILRNENAKNKRLINELKEEIRILNL